MMVRVSMSKAPVPPPRSRPDMSPVPPDLMPWKIGGNRGVSGSIKDLQSHQDVVTVESRYHPDLPRSHYDKSRCHYDTGTASLRLHYGRVTIYPGSAPITPGSVKAASR